MAARRRPPFDKAAFRKAQTQSERPDQVCADGVHPQILKQARKSGQLNLSGRGLTEVPASVWSINRELPAESKHVSLENTDDRWWEQADLTKIILSSNALTEISADIAQLSALTFVDVHDNQLTCLPEALGQLENLGRLNVSRNSLTALPACLPMLRNLIVLRLEHNQLTELPEDIGSLVNLDDLDVSHNRLSEVPAGIGWLSKVVRLNLANNAIRVLPNEVGSMRSLKMLDATHNQIHALPDDIGNLSQLEQLYLRHNKLTCLPLLHSCSSLKELHIGNNAIMGLPAEHLQCLQGISVLDVRDNRITTLPEEIELLQHLERLDLTNNGLSMLPYVLGTLPNLKSIVLDGNPMKAIRRDIIQRGTQELKKYLVSRMEKSVSPRPDTSSVVRSTAGTSGIIGGTGEGVDVHGLEMSKVLNYSEKKAASIPDELWNLIETKGVISVNFSKNLLSEWPVRLASAANSLRELYLGFNQLTMIESSIGALVNLQNLDLRNNKLTDLPGEMISLQRLREITLSCNRLRQLPAVLYKLQKLEIILANDNQIQTIDPGGLQGLSVLATLNLQNNNMDQVPPELGLCTQLRSLQLEGNAFRVPRPAILTKGTIAVLEFLRSRIVN